MSFEKSKERINKFIKFLLEESQKPTSSIFPETAWQKLNELNENLTQLPNEDFDKIDNAILDWLENNQYTSIQQTLKLYRSDPLGDREDQNPPHPDPRYQPITNISLRSAIKEAQENRNNQQQESE